MRPAFSVLFLTTLLGAGQGLAMVLVGIEVAARFAAPQPGQHTLLVVGCAVSFVLAGLGLLASFFHLGHPERAWRAIAGWRTSWLSREVIALPLFLAAVGAWGTAIWGAQAQPSALALALGLLTFVLSVVLFVCTGMIYAAVKVIREWASPLTVVNYVLLGSASGATLAAALAAFIAPGYRAVLVPLAVGMTLVAAVTRFAAAWRNARLVPKSTLQTAIGIRHPQIAQKAQGAMGGSFNTREFFHGASDRTVAWVRRGFPLLAFGVPLVLLSTGSAGALVLAFPLQMAGLLAERWFFFAQANHPQNLYYQSIA
jgi:DMSO reductase anchor subunit